MIFHNIKNYDQSILQSILQNHNIIYIILVINV